MDIPPVCEIKKNHTFRSRSQPPGLLIRSSISVPCERADNIAEAYTLFIIRSQPQSVPLTTCRVAKEVGLEVTATSKPRAYSKWKKIKKQKFLEEDEKEIPISESDFAAELDDKA